MSTLRPFPISEQYMRSLRFGDAANTDYLAVATEAPGAGVGSMRNGEETRDRFLEGLGTRRRMG